MNPFQILLVEDDTDLREAISVTLRLGGVDHVAFECAEDALPAIDPEVEQMLVTDFRLPGMNGLQLLAQAREKHPQLPVVVMTAYADTQLAVQALKGGARDFLIKPFMPQQLLEVIARHHPSPPAAKTSADGEIIASDPAILAVKNRCERVAGTGATVLLTGESGVGKDVFAKQIHQLSGRNSKPYVAINCAAIPDNLLESELFGYEKGAFTGANASRMGLIEAADGGTLFLDEIGELPMEAQARLLRFIQEGEIRRIGSVHSRKVNVRLICATHRNLQSLAAEGEFRQDLFYRINVLQLLLPPLRERGDDVALLVKFYAERFAHKNTPISLTPDFIAALKAYDWPGNVRELAAVMDRAAILGDGQSLEVATALGANPASAARPGPARTINSVNPARDGGIATLDDAMRAHIALAISVTHGRIEGPHGAARLLERARHAEVLERRAAVAQARGVDQLHCQAVDVDLLAQDVARGTGDLRHNGRVLAAQEVQQA